MKRSRYLMGAGVAALLIAHAALVLRSYPPGLWTRGEPPLKGDVDRYYATACGAARAGGLYGYDISSMAGYPVGLWNSMGKKGFEVFHLLLPWVGLPRLFYGVLTGLALLAPVLAWWSVRRDLPGSGSRRWLLVLLVAFWQLDAQVSYFWNFGNVFFPATVCLVLVACGLAGRVLGVRTARGDARPPRYGVAVAWGLLLGLVLAAIFYFHTVVIVAAVVPLIALVAFTGRTVTRPGLIGLAAALGVASALCLPWLIPLVQSRADCVPQPKEWFQGGLKYLIMDAFSDRAYQHHFDRNFLLKVAVVFGSAGLWVLHRRGEAPVARALGWGAVAALAITHGLPLLGWGGALQPYRFTIAVTLLFLPAAAEGICSVARVVRRLPREGRAVMGLLLVLLCPALTGYVIDLGWNGGDVGVTRAHEEVARFLDDLGVRGRVLCDDAGLGHVLPALSRHTVIGGLSSQAFLKHRFAGIDEDGIVFGRPLADWPPARLDSYLEAYAVEILVLSRPRHVRYAEAAAPVLVPAGQVGNYRLFRTRQGTAAYVAAGAAEAAVDTTGLRVSAAQSRELLLKFHYVPWMIADSGVRLEPHPLFDDPVPFVRAVLPEGVTDFRVEFNPRDRVVR